MSLNQISSSPLTVVLAFQGRPSGQSRANASPVALWSLGFGCISTWTQNLSGASGWAMLLSRLNGASLRHRPAPAARMPEARVRDAAFVSRRAAAVATVRIRGEALEERNASQPAGNRGRQAGLRLTEPLTARYRNE